MTYKVRTYDPQPNTDFSISVTIHGRHRVSIVQGNNAVTLDRLQLANLCYDTNMILADMEDIK